MQGLDVSQLHFILERQVHLQRGVEVPKGLVLDAVAAPRPVFVDGLGDQLLDHEELLLVGLPIHGGEDGVALELRHGPGLGEVVQHPVLFEVDGGEQNLKLLNRAWKAFV